MADSLNVVLAQLNLLVGDIDGAGITGRHSKWYEPHRNLFAISRRL